MPLGRVGRSVFAAVASGATITIAACNALVGNGDIQFAMEAGPDDATTGGDDHDDAAAIDVAPSPPDDVDLRADVQPDALAGDDGGCPADSKSCSSRCVRLDDPGYGCGSKACNPCELANANAACGPPAVDAVDGGDGGDGGADGGGAMECVPLCKANHGDCNRDPLDGCEIDTSADLYNCGACGHDCSNLPHVAGNIACVAGVCTFDKSSCAPGYGICSTNPDDGCNTVISDPAHCGGCTTPCSDPGFPYCSPTGNAAQPFACTSGCAAGLSLCEASCVNENGDPSHCGGCNTQCGPVAGGTPTCGGGGRCGFTCNANDHLCGTGAGSSCAANNDPTSCGIGAACTKCGAPANATATCAGGTACGYACNPNAHACGLACPLDSDPNNCGSLCGTNCPGSTAGSGAATCLGNACAITCAAGATLCGSACVNEQTDIANCGACGTTCAAGQACSGGTCVCNASSCPGGCCDASGTCQSKSCGTGGAACALGCPATLPEASSLALWLVGDSYSAASGKWLDQSGRHADASCSGCPTALASAAIGHQALTFNGAQYFTLSDPRMQYATQSWTIFLVANPDPDAMSNAQLIAFSNGSNVIGLQRSGAGSDLLLQLLPGSSTNSLVAPNAWGGGGASGWEWIAANVDASAASLSVSGAGGPAGAIGAPASVDYLSSYLGTDPSQTLDYTGQIAEVVVFTADLSAASVASVEAYLSSRYGGL